EHLAPGVTGERVISPVELRDIVAVRCAVDAAGEQAGCAALLVTRHKRWGQRIALATGCHFRAAVLPRFSVDPLERLPVFVQAREDVLGFSFETKFDNPAPKLFAD